MAVICSSQSCRAGFSCKSRDHFPAQGRTPKNMHLWLSAVQQQNRLASSDTVAPTLGAGCGAHGPSAAAGIPPSLLTTFWL